MYLISLYTLSRSSICRIAFLCPLAVEDEINDTAGGGGCGGRGCDPTTGVTGGGGDSASANDRLMASSIMRSSIVLMSMRSLILWPPT